MNKKRIVECVRNNDYEYDRGDSDSDTEKETKKETLFYKSAFKLRRRDKKIMNEIYGK